MLARLVAPSAATAPATPAVVDESWHPPSICRSDGSRGSGSFGPVARTVGEVVPWVARLLLPAPWLSVRLYRFFISCSLANAAATTPSAGGSGFTTGSGGVVNCGGAVGGGGGTAEGGGGVGLESSAPDKTSGGGRSTGEAGGGGICGCEGRVKSIPVSSVTRVTSGEAAGMCEPMASRMARERCAASSRSMVSAASRAVAEGVAE